MFGSVTVGIMLFCVQLTSTILLGIIFRGHGRTSALSSHKKTSTAKPIPFYQNFVNSVNSCARALFSVCAFIVLFSGLTSLLSASGVSDAISNFFVSLGGDSDIIKTLQTGILEVVSGCRTAGQFHGNTAVLMACGFLSFTGISVIFQILSTLRDTNLSVKKFIIGRLVHPLLSIPLCFAALKLFPLPVSAAMSSTDSAVPTVPSYSPFVSILMVILSALLILFFTKEWILAEKSDNINT